MEEIKTIYGYPVEDLILLAQSLKKEGITVDKLKDFRLSFETAAQLVWEDFEDIQSKEISKWQQ